jgi:P27 family predicted phage terminase small subunit
VASSKREFFTMRRGPPPTPSFLTVVRGNPGKRGIRPEFEPVTMPSEPPEPPDWLPADAAVEWRRLAGELWRLHLLTVLDVMPFAAYCTALARWQQAERVLASDGGSLTGTALQRLTRLAARERADATRYGAVFGIGPPNRQRLAGGRAPSGKFAGLLA